MCLFSYENCLSYYLSDNMSITLFKSEQNHIERKFGQGKSGYNFNKIKVRNEE